MSGHTPGPWRYSMSYGRYGYGGEPDGEYIITGSGPHGGHVYPILGRTHNWPKNAEANARLIAAAPDLLAACKAASVALGKMSSTASAIGIEGTSDWDHLAGGSDLFGTLDTLRAAIAKAEQP